MTAPTICGQLLYDNEPSEPWHVYARCIEPFGTEHSHHDSLGSLATEPVSPITERLAYLRSQIDAECISQGEIDELQSLADTDLAAFEGDVVLLEWAGVPEFTPTCDYCGKPQDADGDDWDGDTGCHVSCEEVDAEITAIEEDALADVEQEPRSDPDGWHEQTDGERIASRGVEW